MLKSAKHVLLGRLTFGPSIGHNSLLVEPIEVIPTPGETRLVEILIHIRHACIRQELNRTEAYPPGRLQLILCFLGFQFLDISWPSFGRPPDLQMT